MDGRESSARDVLTGAHQRTILVATVVAAISPRMEAISADALKAFMVSRMHINSLLLKDQTHVKYLRISSVFFWGKNTGFLLYLL